LTLSFSCLTKSALDITLWKFKIFKSLNFPADSNFHQNHQTLILIVSLTLRLIIPVKVPLSSLTLGLCNLSFPHCSFLNLLMTTSHSWSQSLLSFAFGMFQQWNMKTTRTFHHFSLTFYFISTKEFWYCHWKNKKQIRFCFWCRKFGFWEKDYVSLFLSLT